MSVVDRCIQQIHAHRIGTSRDSLEAVAGITKLLEENESRCGKFGNHWKLFRQSYTRNWFSGFSVWVKKVQRLDFTCFPIKEILVPWNGWRSKLLLNNNPTYLLHVWNIYLHVGQISQKNIWLGKYSSLMEHLGIVKSTWKASSLVGEGWGRQIPRFFCGG